MRVVLEQEDQVGRGTGERNKGGNTQRDRKCRGHVRGSIDT